MKSFKQETKMQKEAKMTKTFRLAAILALTSTTLPALADPIQAVLYKNPECSCCEEYAKYTLTH